MIKIPRFVGEITASWLRKAVRSDRPGAFSNLVSVASERLEEGVGLTTQIHRLRLTYSPGAAPGPTSLIVKLQSPSAAMREVARTFRLYEREVAFYRDIAASVPIQHPRAYAAEIDPATHAFVLVMEDISGATNGDQIAGLSSAQLTAALDQIAELHVSWWARPDLKGIEAAIPPFGEGPWAGIGEVYGAAWSVFETFAAGRVSGEMLRVGERMAASLDGLLRDVAKPPRTLCHGDFRADNLLFTPYGDQLRLNTVDWQMALQARGPFDLGYLLAMSVTSDTRREHERPLLRRYHERLLAAGIEGYGFDECFNDYRRGLLISLMHVTLSGAASDLAHPRTETLFDCGMRRIEAAVQDLGLSEFVG